MATVYLFPRHDGVDKFSWRLLSPRECLVILTKLSVSVEQGIYHTSILYIRQIFLLETALSLVLVTCPDSDYLDESSGCNLSLWGKSVEWSSSGRH